MGKLAEYIAQAFRVDLNTYDSRKMFFGGVIVGLDKQDTTEVHPNELDRRADGQTTQRLVEVQANKLRGAIRWRKRGLLIFGQHEFGVFCCGLGLADGRVTKGDAARQNGGDRLGLHLETVCSDGYINAAGVPEARIGRDELVIRCVYKDLQIDRAAVVAQQIRGNTPHRNAAVVNGRAYVERTQIAGLEHKGSASHVANHGRRSF